MDPIKEGEMARHWREKIMKLSRRELADLTGFSPSRISDIEQGRNRTSGIETDEANMRRYRLACAAVTLGVEFDWSEISLKTALPLEIKLNIKDQGE